MIRKTRALAPPEWLPETVWPFETFGLEVDGCLLAVTETGRGPALLLVHAGAWSFIWRDLMRQLGGEFRCICFDAPGSGRSGAPRGTASPLEGAARAVAGVIERLHLDELTLVAHDLGGIAGLAGAARTPERVRGIVALNAFGWKPAGAAFRGMLALMGSPLVREIDVATDFLSRIASTSFGVGRQLDEASRQAFRAGMNGRGRRSFHNYIRDARHCDALYDEIGRGLAGPFAKHPLISIFGERNDPFGFQARWKELFPDAVQKVVEQGNHFPMCDAPVQVGGWIRDWHRERVSVEVKR